MAAINLDIGGNTRRLDRDIQKTVNRVYNINLKTKGDQPLGRITGQVNEFNKSLDASNARVIAFGASAGIIFGVQRAFSAMVGATIEVQKSLQDINVILNVSAQNLQKFGGELFNIAKNTGQSFAAVATAATEFSRQGLGVEETLKRTNEALILSRLSGLDTAKSVEALTAAVNSFASQAVTATEVVNKFANVDAAFAVSSADLAEALARVGSSAAQSGVSLNELIAIVTSAQQTTARGGAVIGNSFKTIFTRLQRGKVVDLLGTLGISDTNASGELKSTIQLLQDLGSVYDTLGARQQAAVAEQVGGVFQINILKAALADLGKEYSIYSSALDVAAGTTDQAIRRNEELNKTYAAQLNALQENARQIASAAGERLIGPSIDRLVGGSNTLLGGINESDGQGVGAVLGKGILDGLGQFIAGPGLALIGGVLLKLFRDLGKFATGSVQQLLGLNTAATQQKDLQASISQILAKNPQLLELALKGEQGLNTAANSLLASLQKQTVELQKQAAVAAQLSKAFISQAGVRVAGGIPVAPAGKAGKAAGYIPNFAEVSQAIELGAPSSVQSVSGVGKIGGKSFEANNKEFQIPDFGGTGETAVIPKYGGGIKETTKMIARGESGSVLDKSDRNRARGFVPNFAVEGTDLVPGLDTVDSLRKKASKSAGLLQNLYNVGEKNIFDQYKKPSIKRIPLPKSLQQYNKEAGTYISNIRDRALKYSDPSKQQKFARRAFSKIKYEGVKISEFTNKVNTNTLLNPKSDINNQSNIKGSMGEIDSQKRFGVLGRSAEKQGDLFGADFLIKKQGGNYLVESKVTQKKVPDNVLIAKALQYEGQITGGKYKKDQKNSVESLQLKNILLSYAPYKKFASGFIPNFAKQKQASKNAIDLGNLDTIPNKLGNKVVSLIHPGLSDGYSLRPATANYLKQDYRGNIPVAGINQKTLKSQLPDLDQNLGNLLVREANQFGQSLGGTNFLKSAKELPNYGAAKGAVGVAFEAGVQTLLQQKIGRKQNAGIDFRNITPRLRSIFNGAPGMYDAKSSPDLTNEVFKKLLNETRPGATVQKSSGQAGKDYLAKRSAAVAELQKEGVTGSVAIRQALRDRFGIVGKAAGYIPNFAALQAPLQNSINEELASGASPSQIRIGQDSRLEAPFNKEGIGVWSKKYEGSLSEGISMAQKSNIDPKTKGRKRSSGFIPNFAIENMDTQGASAGTAIAAVAAQLSGLAFAFAFSKDQVKTALNELTSATKAAASAQRNETAKEIREKRTQLRAESAANRASLGIGPLTREQQETITRDNATAARQDPTLAPKREAAGKAARPGFGAKAGAFLDANAFALSIAAPIIGETIKNLVGTETKTARGVGAAASGLGQAGSFAATGQLLGGGKGAAVGAVIGSILAIPEVVNQLVSDVPELTKAANLASQDLTKFSEAGQRYFVSMEKLTTAISAEGDNSKLVAAARQEYIKALSDLSVADQKSLTEAEKLGKAQEKYAQLLDEKVAKERGAKAALEVGGIVAESITGQSIKQYLGGIPRLLGKGFDFIDTQIASDFGMEKSGLGESVVSAYTPESGFDPQSSNAKVLERSFLDLALAGKNGSEAISRLDEILKAFVGPDGKTTDVTTAEDLKNLLSQEEILGTQDEGSIRLVEQLTKRLDNLTGEEEVKKAVGEIITVLRKGALGAREKNVQAVSSEDAGRVDREERIRVAKQEQAAIDATISSIQKNIAVQNLWRSAIENINESIRGFSRDLQITQTLTQPREVLSGLIGEDKTPTRRLAAQEGIAQIDASSRSGLATAGIGFKETLRGITETPFQENIDKIIKDLSTESGGLQGPKDEIEKRSQTAQTAALAEQQKLTQAMGNMEAYMAQFVNGQISTQQLLEASKSELAGVGIDVNRGSKASNGIEKAVAELEVKTLQEEVKAFQQRAKLASETKQAILQSRIDQALGTFGGFEGFMNRPEEEENYIQRIGGDLKNVEEMRSSPTFRYNNKESIKEQEKQAPELGRSFAKIYKELIDQSGGGFRSVIQSAIDAGPQLTGAESRSGRAGASARGGFDDIVRGRKQDLEEQLKLAEDQIKVTKDPTLKRDLEGFVSSIRNMPGGTQGIAQLQTQKELGVARQSDFQKLFKQYDIAAFDALSEVSPELAASLASATALTDDPLLNEASAQTAVQSEILKTIKGLSGQESGMVAPFDIEAYSNEKDPAKRAAMKANYGGVSPVGIGSTASDDVKKQIKAIQDKVLPTTPKPAVTVPQKTISEIEAETRAKRDQKYLQSPVAPMNRTTGKQFGSVEEVDAEMNKALALGAINPDQKDYYKVLQNFKQNLDPTGGTDPNRNSGRDGRNYMFNLDDRSRPVDPNSPLEIEKRTAAESSPSFASKMMFGEGDFYDAIRSPYTYENEKYQVPYYKGRDSAVGPYAQNPAPSFSEFGSFSDEEYARGTAQGGVRNYNPDYGLPYSFNEKAKRSVLANDYFMDSKALDRTTFGYKLPYNLASDGDERSYRMAQIRSNPTNSEPPARSSTNIAPMSATSQSFTQQEAAFNTNTSALTTLAGGIESLNSTFANFETNFANLNNTPGTQTVAGAQPNVQTTTNAPVNVIVNAESDVDIATAVGEAVKKAIPSIIDQVRRATGEKIPPKVGG